MERFDDVVNFQEVLASAAPSLRVEQKNGAGPVMHPTPHDIQPASLGNIHDYAEVYLSRLADSLAREYKEPPREPRRNVELRSDVLIYTY